MADSPKSRSPGAPRDLRTRDFATPDSEPATLLAGSDDTDPLPNRRYTSILFWRFVKALDAAGRPVRILDLGPTAEQNIHFWGDRGFKVTCFDLARREAEFLADEPISNVTLAPERLRRRQLPFDDESFSAVCAWNAFSRIPFVVARRYARECYRVVVPRGLVHAVFLDAAGRLDCRRTYRVADRQQLDVASGPPPRSASSAWVEAELAYMFSPFDACETKPAPFQTRELLAQKGPLGRPAPRRR